MCAELKNGWWTEFRREVGLLGGKGMSKSGWRSLLLAVVMLVAIRGIAKAQEVSGSISGTVLDPSGASVKDAMVTLTNTDRGHDERVVETDTAGFYTASSLPLGTYTIKVVAHGFQTSTVTGLVLHVNDTLTVNRTMAVGSSDQTVTVSADAVQLNLEDGTTAGLITGTQVRELVLNNRNYEQLVALQPGVSYGGATDQLYIGASAPSGTTSVVSFSINGQRNSANNWTIDGADNVDRGSNLTLLAYPSVDAIAEFKTLRGTYSAQFGRSASSQINVVTRSGTNAFHGSAYEFFRNDKLNANNYFNNLSGVSRPLLRYNDFGFTVGGPVWLGRLYDGRDKTFFFYSQEFRRVINYASATNLVPTALERTGDFSQTSLATVGGTTPVGQAAICVAASAGNCTAFGKKVSVFSPTAQAYLKDVYAGVPLPNPGPGQDIHTLQYNQRYVYNDAQEFLRIDQAIGTKANLFYRYLHDSLPTVEAAGIFAAVGTGLPGVQTTRTTEPATTHLGHLTFTFTPTLLVDAGYAYSSGAILSDPVGTAAVANSPDIKPTLPYQSILGVIPTVSIAGATGIANPGIYRDYNHNHNVFADVTKVLGSHTIILGGYYDHYQKTENATATNQGAFTFNTALPTAAQAAAAGGGIPSTFASAFANFLIGNANGGFTQASMAVTPNVQASQVEAYVQDNWKAARRLSLNLGVRYTYFAQPHDANGLLSNFDSAAYVRANAPTVDSNGNLCKSPLASCANTNGANGGLPNPNADPLNGIILGTPGSNGHASPFGSQVGNTDKRNFAPRFGFAMDVFGDGKTSFRGGYGIAFDSSLFGIYEQNEFANPPYVVTPNYAAVGFDNPSQGQVVANLTPPTLVASPFNYHTPYVQQFSVDVQQEVTPTLMLDVGYVGNHGTHLLGQIDINEARPGAFVTANVKPGSTCKTTSTTSTVPAGTPAFLSTVCDRPLNQIRPYLGYGPINAVESIFSSNYNSLQVMVQKKLSEGSYINAAYTWSRGLTNNQSDRSTAPQNTYNIAGEYGRAALDRTNIITINGVWELPWQRNQEGLIGHLVGGWELSGIVAVNSGLPLTVTMSGGGLLPDGSVANDAAGLGVLGTSAVSLRPNQVADPNSGYGQTLKKRLNWFNKLAFSAPTPGSLAVGNERRGVIEGPGYNRIDLGAFRNIKIHEGVNFQFRAEGFNVLNHTNWQSVGTSATTGSTFGQVTTARDNRILDVGAKLVF